MFNNEEKNNILKVKEQVKNLLFQDNFFNYYKTSTRNPELSPLYVAGGVFASLLRDEQPNDVDVFFRDIHSAEFMKETLLLNADQLTSHSKHVGDDAGVSSKRYSLTVSRNNISYIVKNEFCGEPSVIKKNFDFVHCLAHYDRKDDKLYISRDTYDAIMNKWLIKNPSNTNDAGISRAAKFVVLGYKPKPKGDE